MGDLLGMWERLIEGIELQDDPIQPLYVASVA